MSRLAQVDLTKSLPREQYKSDLIRHQIRLRELAFQCYRQRRSVILVCEGWDAAGKGGSIRRITGKVDPRGIQVYSIAAPHGDDKQHHYLWRFWRRLLPADEKQLLIFDRSWYGRILVERVEGFAETSDWQRAYGEINDFEQQLTDQGFLLVKYWFHIDRDEQWRRFEARRATAHKRWKLTDEDFRNREKWAEYESAVDEMLERTSPPSAPWTVIEANDKYYARVKSLGHLVGVLEEALQGEEPSK